MKYFDYERFCRIMRSTDAGQERIGIGHWGAFYNSVPMRTLIELRYKNACSATKEFIKDEEDIKNV